MTLFNAQGNYLTGPELPLVTRKMNHIPNEQRSPRAPASMHAAKSFVLNQHSSASVRSLSSLYNCMGMVFASRRTWVEPDHLRMILNDDGYRQVSSMSDLKAGDVVVYYDDGGEVSHVGLVVNVKPDLTNGQWEVTVLSQWGRDGEYFHLVDDVNPLLGRPLEYWTDRT